MFFTGKPVRDWQSVKTSDTERFARYFSEMFKRGIYLAPSQFEAGFISTAHDETSIEMTILAAGQALEALEAEKTPGR